MYWHGKVENEFGQDLNAVFGTTGSDDDDDDKDSNESDEIRRRQ